ncbi:uncharacterized protein FMAN_14161 [Fusarium mangiferae]|uniref:DUF3295 domain-containing protein n=1 Tax=Fusarium mangiferae TaxID=192010 RepID=A0A1L7UK78_FUSMA|nr:uncharacterized protein FMAN_14161 [Fusarium mangiferae]CVL08197.1 uncharacterized protein FMAN_14161 [Fusarium mangiferae]
MPELSRSIVSLIDEEVVDSTPVSEIARPRVRRQDSCASTRSKRDHNINSDDSEKMIVPIVKNKGPLSASRCSCRQGSKLPAKSITASEGSSQPSSQSPSRTTVVHGFWPSQIPPPQTIPGAAPSSDEIQERQSSPVSSEQGQSLRNNKPVFQIGSLSKGYGSLQSAAASRHPSSRLSESKKHVSFSNNAMTPIMDYEAAVDSDTDDYNGESAIDDNDDSPD